ncbi:MAG: deoxyribonuclease IV [Chloroflexota bacterium]
MLPNGRRLGAHLPLAAGMVRAADRAAEIGASAMQVFVDNPTSWRRRPTLPAELPEFRRRLAAADVAPVSVHAPYLANLAGPDEETWTRSIELLANELRVAAAYGAAFVNMHTGSHRGEGTEAGVARLAEGLRRVVELAGDEAASVVLILENSSGGGFGMGATPEELGAIDRAAGALGVPRDRLGFCLDTAHLWGAGFGVDTAGGVDQLLAEFDQRVGLDRLRMVHLNDSRSSRGSGLDRHEHLGGGRIGHAGLARFLVHPALEHVAYITETPGMEEGWDQVNLARARALAAGEPLPPLPPDAFTTRSARGRAAPPERDGDAPGPDAPTIESAATR